MAYLSFMSDEHLLHCIEQLYNTYDKCKKDFNLNNFYKNKIDPIKFFFDMKFNAIEIEDYINSEITRKNDKTISNAIGKFHQQLLDGLDGFEAPDASGYDVKKLDNSIFGELKNKHNTMNSSSAIETFNKLRRFAEQYPSSNCYLIEIISLRSKDELWTFSDHGVSFAHPRIRKISADKFYELATGIHDSFKQLCYVIPIATFDFLESKGITPKQTATNSTVYTEISNKASRNDILTQMLIDTFDTYNGF